jgi:hypothetical protein
VRNFEEEVISPPRIILDGNTGSIELTGLNGKKEMYLSPDLDRGKYSGLFLGERKAGMMIIRNSLGSDSMVIDGHNANLHLGISGKPGKLVLQDGQHKDAISMDARNGSIGLSDTSGIRRMFLNPNHDNYSALFLGEGNPGIMVIRDSAGNDSITLDGAAGRINGKDSAGRETITLDCAAGDFFLNNADCAEDFDISETGSIEPEDVMVIDQEGKLKQSTKTYDKRVAGVISGAGNYKPGLVLDKRKSNENRKSISLMGKVYCKVDAQSAPIDVGDLLTTSSTKGHAMKAADPAKAFGSVIGKALRPLKAGISSIPILIALQ